MKNKIKPPPVSLRLKKVFELQMLEQNDRFGVFDFAVGYAVQGIGKGDFQDVDVFFVYHSAAIAEN
ncbi:MAG: hypothetical protein LH606_16985 [Cytophagaceae bacterium]|nr:hypothetical protein [Cytophagaceae bacterium]